MKHSSVSISVAPPPRLRKGRGLDTFGQFGGGAQIGVLELLVGSRARAEIFRILFGLNRENLCVAEIVERSGMAEQGVDDQLRKLAAQGLLLTHKDRSRRYYHANIEHPAFFALNELVLKTSGLRDILAEAVKQSGVECAFVFGSVARKEERFDSDVDLMILGDATHRDLASRLAPLSEKIGRELNPHFFNLDELHRRILAKDHFLKNVMDGDKLFVVGNDVTLARLLSRADKEPKV